MRTRLADWPLPVFAILVLGFLSAPILVVVAASFSQLGDVRIPFGPVTLSAYAEFLSSPKWIRAVGISTLIAVLSAAITSAIAVMVAVPMTRLRFRGKPVAELAILSPLILPHAALALALYSVIYAFGILGSFRGVLLGHIVATLPFAFGPIYAAMHRYDQAFDEAAMSLGARPWYVFLHVTVPVLRPGIAAGFLFAFIMSFDEVTVTMFLKGPLFTTLPVQIFSEVQEGSARIVPAVSTSLIAVTIAFIFLIKRLIGLDVFIDKNG